MRGLYQLMRKLAWLQAEVLGAAWDSRMLEEPGLGVRRVTGCEDGTDFFENSWLEQMSSKQLDDRFAEV